MLDIQQEIRRLDSKVNEISASITCIYDEIDELRDDDADDIDYETIRLISLHFSFGKHPLSKLNDAYARQIYISPLLSLVQTDHGSEVTVNRLIFIQWLVTQAHLDISLEDLFKNALKASSNTFGMLVELLPKQYREQLVVDALIVANISGLANNKVLTYIASLAGVLGITKEQLSILCILARGVLKQEFGRMKNSELKKVLAHSKYFKHYLNDNLLQAMLISQRTIAVELPDNSCWDFKWKVKQQSEIEQGDLIAIYRSKPARWDSDTIEITAPCDGTIFQFRNNCINYGVIAHETDSKDSIKAWVIQMR